MLSRKEKEELIIKLLKEGKNFKQISKEAHVSYTLITMINRKLSGDYDNPSLRTQAYRMFLDGKRPIDVATELDIPHDEVTKLWKEYLQLAGHYKVLKIAEELKGKFQSFFHIYSAMKRKHLTIEEVEEQIKRDREFNFELKNKEEQSIDLNEQIKEQKDILSKLNIEIGIQSVVKMVLIQVLDNMRREKERLELFLRIDGDRYNYQRNNRLIRLPYRTI